MDQLLKKAEELHKVVSDATNKIGLESLKSELENLKIQSIKADFWSEAQKASATMKEISNLEQRVSPWIGLSSDINDCLELIKSGDENLKQELEKQVDDIQASYDALKGELRFNGPHDQDSAILSIYAGAGGTDAQDWAQMLLRMYVRWCEKIGYKIITVDESAGDEAGLKSVTIEINGNNAYGKLKGEHGVHRLVRLSPFNADSLRQTSFAKVEVLPKIEKPEDLEIDEKDLKIDVYRSGGHGGQSVNTTDSAVRITHLPTGITVAIQNERSQLQNRETAMTILSSKLVQLQMEQHLEKLADLKGDNQSAEWGNQIRNYVLHPYKMVKDLRTGYETSDTDAVLDGNLDPLIDAYIDSVLQA